MKPTEKLQRDVVAELAWDPRVDSSEISVTATGNGVITLEGEVPTFWQKRAVELAAKRVAGVRAVANDLEVRLVREHHRDDTELAERAITAVGWQGSVPEERVRVTVSDGWVTLEGAVPWEYQRRAAEEAVRGLIGVRGVSNLIEIEARPVAEGEEQRRGGALERIEEAFRRNAELDAEALEVRTSGDRVVLSGDVATWRQREEAEWIAWAAGGIAEVDNRIEVRSGGGDAAGRKRDG